METKIKFNYYQLKLLSFLMESHPVLANDSEFIKERANKAAIAEEEALIEGYNQMGAQEISNNILFEGLLFSKFDTVKNLILTKFNDQLPDGTISAFAKVIQPKCEDVFIKFQPKNNSGNAISFPDDYASTIAFDNLEEELTTRIKFLLDNYGIQQKGSSC